MSRNCEEKGVASDRAGGSEGAPRMVEWGGPGPRARALSRAETRELDREAAERFGLPTLVLMENAGRGAADALRTRWLARDGDPTRHRALILAGPGNNGGDGGVVARFLDLAGIPVRVVWIAEPDRLAPDAAVQRRILEASGVPQAFLAPGEAERSADELTAGLAWATWVVDGLFGTGLSRPPRGTFAAAIRALNASGRPVWALDLPSGLDADTGEPLDPSATVRATATATLAAPKRGFANPSSAFWLGEEVVVTPIGAPRALLERYAEVDPGPRP